MEFVTIGKKQKKIIPLFSFLFKSVLFMLLVAIVILTFFIIIYYVDLLLNVNNSSKKPLFGAYIIVSQSMLPTIKVNDAIVVKRDSDNNYNIGDIITFSSSDTNYKGLKVTHRIVKKKSISNNKSIYITKGDNNPVNDSALVSSDSIYGKVLFRIPKVGNIKKILSNPINYCYFLLLIASVLTIYKIFRTIFLIISIKRS